MARLALFALPMLIVACGPRTTETPSELADACAGLDSGDIVIIDAWVRTAATGQAATAAYLTICNRSPHSDALVSASSDASEVVELHQTTRDDDGVARMSHADEIPVQAGASARLAPGGLHIMLIDLSDAVEEGEAVPLTLVFKSGKTLYIEAEARANASSGHEH